MKRMPSRRRELTLAISIALAAHIAAAADDEAAGTSSRVQDGEGLSTVTVTARRESALPKRPSSSLYGTDTRIVDTPRAVSQISEEQLERELIVNGDDLVRYAPGVTRGGGQNVSVAPLIRGQNSELFQDGQRTYNVRHPFNVNAYEGADIVAGPVPQVFGPSARSGGYTNYLTKKPRFEHAFARVSTDFGTWVPGESSFDSSKVTLDFGARLAPTLAYRVSATTQRAEDYYDAIKNDYNAFYAALAWTPRENVRVDWNGSYDDYFDFNVTHGWNRATQQLADDGKYYAGRATPIISVGSGADTRYYSPVFASGAYDSEVIGWQERTPNAQRQFIAGPLLSADELPPFLTSPETPGTVRGWVYDPTLPGNELVSISPRAFSRPQDKNTARRITTQLRTQIDLNPTWSVVNSTLLQDSKDTGDSVGSFLSQFEDRIFDTRFELRGGVELNVLGLKIEDDINVGTSWRRESFLTLAANNSFTTHPYDLTAPLEHKTPATLYGLTAPTTSGSWIGTPNVPQLSAQFGYLSLRPMYPVANGLYAEVGGSPSGGGAVYTAKGHWSTTGLFAQNNFLINDRIGLNIGLNASYIDATIRNPLVISPERDYSDTHDVWLPSYQGSLYYKLGRDSSVYFTYDRSYALNTGGFADVLTWGARGNTLEPLNFRSLSILREVGFKSELVPERVFASIAAFRQNRDQSPLTDGTVPRIELDGVEAAVRFDAWERIKAGLNFTWLDGRYTYLASYGGGFISPYGFVADNATVFADGNALNQRAAPGAVDVPGIPEYSLNGYVDYEVGRGFGARIDAWWTSSWYTNVTRTVEVPAEHNVNLTLYYERPAWDAAVRFSNITDQTNFTNGLAGPTTEFLQPIRGFSVQAALNFRFGAL